MQASRGGNIVPFLRYTTPGFVDGLRDQVKFIWKQQWDVAWQNHVHEQFQGKHSASDIHQRHLTLDLSVKDRWVSVGEITELTPRLAEAYAGKTSKAV